MTQSESEIFVILQSADETLPYLEEVQAMADAAKNEFGFLPAAAYHNHAIRGLLWVITNKTGRLIGYLLFGGRFPQLKIFQLHVPKEFRRLGVGQKLIESLKSFCVENNYQCISARVASELLANHFWHSVGFQIVDQLNQSEKRRTLNVYSFELEENSLFSSDEQGNTEFNYLNATQLRSSTYALDLNIYFDVTKNRPYADDARKILGLAMSGRVNISVTKEFVAELKRTSEDGKLDPLLEFAYSIPTLPEIDEASILQITDSIRTQVFPNRSLAGRTSVQDNSDLKHLAICIHHGISGFVTRENALLRVASELRSSFGIDILAPWELIDTDVSLHALDNDFSIDEDRSILVVERMKENARSDIANFLESIGVPSKNVPSLLSPGDSINQKVRVVARLPSGFVGYLCYSNVGVQGHTDAFLYMDENSYHFGKVLDHFIQSLEGSLPVRRVTRISISFLKKMFSTHEKLREKEYHSSDAPSTFTQQSVFAKWCYTGPVLRQDWLGFIDSYKEPYGIELPKVMPTYEELQNTGLFPKNIESGKRFQITLREFETKTSSLLAAEGRPILIVPIQLGYANRLLGVINKQLFLNLSKSEALMLPERAYFTATGASKKIAPGAILLFYVSGKGGGNKSIVGMARTTFAKKMTIESAKTALRRQGVLEEKDLESRGNSKGELFALTFDTYINFPREITYQKLIEFNCIKGSNLVKAQPISDSNFEDLITFAFSEH